VKYEKKQKGVLFNETPCISKTTSANNIQTQQNVLAFLDIINTGNSN